MTLGFVSTGCSEGSAKKRIARHRERFPSAVCAADNSLTVTATANTLFGYSVPKADGTFATKALGVGPAIVKLAQNLAPSVVA